MMPRLTKTSIERQLLSGESISWRDASKKRLQITLGEPEERRLFAYLLASRVREPAGLSDDFVAGLSTAFNGTDDPRTSLGSISTASLEGPWRLQSIETDGFGGLNTWKGPPFRFLFDGESLLAEGPNGCGKSSFIGAILWTLSGERPRDQTSEHAHEPRPVLGIDEKPAGDWPPIACYPLATVDLKTPPRVRAILTFINGQGKTATVERTLDGGTITTTTTPHFEVPSILIEAGLLMPARLGALRLDEGRGRLTEAVQKLTGLDDLIAIGALTDGLCNRGREYLTYKRKDLATARSEFDQALGEARSALVAASVTVPIFVPLDTDDKQGAMAKFGKALNEKAAELTKVVSDDLATGLDLASPAVQHEVIVAIGTANSELEAGLGGMAAWKSLQTVACALNDETKIKLATVVSTARERAEEAVALLARSSKDSRFQLKVVAARWHHNHHTGMIDNCPLCEHPLKDDPSLAQELELLRAIGDPAARTFDDNLRSIISDLNEAVPASIRPHAAGALALEPRKKLESEIRATFVTKDRYAKILTRFGSLVDAALLNAPRIELAAITLDPDETVLEKVNETITVIERLVALAGWFHINATPWSDWWIDFARTSETIEGEYQIDSSAGAAPERLVPHLQRLSDALAKAEPYRKAAEAMRKTWKAGQIAYAIEKEVKKRDTIAKGLSPLKNLGSLAESVARETIEGLSDRIDAILKNTLLTDQLKFRKAKLNRRDGLVVTGGFVDDLHIDATLVANTSWIRAVLWAFVFALREEAIEQIGGDQFPLFAFDDPQATFDGAHRHRWAQYVTSLQHGPSKAQVILATHDEMFRDLIKVSGITGRQAMIASASPELKCIGIFDGESLDRKWAEVTKANTNAAGAEYIEKVRKYVEGLLRLMLRGEDATVMSVVSGYVVGDARDKINQLHTRGIAPWDRSEFRKLVGMLDKNLPAIKHMEISHHSGATMLGMAEAKDVETHWRTKLSSTLTSAFRLAREFHHLHGGLTALHAPPPAATLPDGYSASVRKIPLNVVGRAAALSDGRAADGRVDLNEFPSSQHKKITLAQHRAFRLLSATLEPVARRGDILLVKEPAEITPRSLVIALSEDRVLARRFEIAANHSDVAVLTAQSVNPHQIAPPVIAHKATLKLYKIIGVIYESPGWNPPSASEMEICACDGEAVIDRLASDSLGLVEVEGDSAVPFALNGQYLVVKKEVTAVEALRWLVDQPIIASDTDDNRYFKRLRDTGEDNIVLESLDSSGEFGPVVLSAPGKGENCLERAWPVAGVIFELPGR